MLFLRVLSTGTSLPFCSPTKEVYNPQDRLPSRDLAGSGSRPLTNIPHCCLPQESGPCLSTSVGDLPLRTPTHRRLGGPLLRQLANAPHAHPQPEVASLSTPEDVSRGLYAVLVRISPGYPPAMGRLHTCYSPVRRSPAGKAEASPPLPLDLHVLSLSLAFILSQDQTLRCCLSCFFFFFKVSFARLIFL